MPKHVLTFREVREWLELYNTQSPSRMDDPCILIVANVLAIPVIGIGPVTDTHAKALSVPQGSLMLYGDPSQ